jgi:hypothetical protein
VEINPAADGINLVIPSKSAVNGQSQALHSRIVALPIEIQENQSQSPEISQTQTILRSPDI